MDHFESENALTEPVEMEGQEAVLVEGGSSDEEKKKAPKRRSFFRKPKSGAVKKGEAAVENISKTKVVLLADDSMRQRASERANQSRMLLEAALHPADPTSRDLNDDQQEQMIKAAFQFAVEARRLFEGDAYEDVETVVSQNTDKGEMAAGKALAILSARKTPTISDGGDGQDKHEAQDPSVIPKEKKWPTRYTPKDIFDEAEKYARRARIHLETILPAFECAPDVHSSANGQPFVPTPGIVTNSQDALTLSTLGFDNTFQEPSFSITSLNEILDGPISPQEPKVDTSDPKSIVKSEGRGAVQSESPSRNPLKKKKGPGKHKKDEEKPVERFVATVVESAEEASVASELSTKSELERLQALDTRTESKLKEAMDADETGSVLSWNGVPVFQPPPEDEPDGKKKKKKKGQKKQRKTDQQDNHLRSSRVKQEKPQFVEAPDNDPNALASLAWSHLDSKKDEEEVQKNQVEGDEQGAEEISASEVVPVPDATATKPKKGGGFGWRKKRRSKKEPAIEADANQMSNGDGAHDDELPLHGEPPSVVETGPDHLDPEHPHDDAPDTEQIPVDSDNVRLGDVETGADEYEKDDAPENIDTTPTQDETAETEPSPSMIEEIKTEKGGEGKPGSRGKRMWRPFSKKKVDKGDDSKAEDAPETLLDNLKVWEDVSNPEGGVESQS